MGCGVTLKVSEAEQEADARVHAEEEGGEEDRGSSKPSAGGDALTLSLETLGHAADPLPHLLVGETLQETPQ